MLINRFIRGLAAGMMFLLVAALLIFWKLNYPRAHNEIHSSKLVNSVQEVLKVGILQVQISQIYEVNRETIARGSWTSGGFFQGHPQPLQQLRRTKRRQGRSEADRATSAERPEEKILPMSMQPS